MNSKLKEINEIISICDDMLKYIEKHGVICNGNPHYNEYQDKIKHFIGSRKLDRKDYAPYVVLDSFYYPQNRSFTLSFGEAQMIRRTVVGMKHELFPNCYEKVFISHREKDKAQVSAFMDLLYAVGITRPTADSQDNAVFCTSHPATYILNGVRNLDEIKRQFHTHEHVLYILWYTDNYFESQACLNEAGAIWASEKKYQEILMPSFNCNKIKGLLDKQPVWFRANDKYRLNTFKEEIEALFNLSPLTLNAWETARDTFIARIESLDGGNNNADA